MARSTDQSKARFTPGELQVMVILWEHGELKPADIQRLHPESIKNAALRSYLTILVEKGHVTRRKEGKAFLYEAVTRKQNAMRSTIKQVIDAYCGGSPEQLLMSLIRSEKLSAEDLIELKRVSEGKADRSKSSKTVTSKRKKR